MKTIRVLALVMLVVAILSACGNGLGAPSGGVPASLIGAWIYGTVSSIEFTDPRTGTWGDPSGIGLYYKFSPNGTFAYAYRESVTNYGCQTVYLVFKEGLVSVSGSRLVLHPKTGEAIYTDSCNPHTNTDKTLTPAQLQDDPYTWQIVTSESGIPNLVLTTPSGATGALRPLE